METNTILFILTAVLFALVVILAIQIKKLKTNFDSQILEVIRNTMKWDANTNGTVTKLLEDMLQLNLARADDITKLRDETPMLEINTDNQAVLYTRQGKEIHNYQLQNSN